MPLLSEIRGHVAILTLSRPEARNAWDEDYNEGLKAHAERGWKTTTRSAA